MANAFTKDKLMTFFCMCVDIRAGETPVYSEKIPGSIGNYVTSTPSEMSLL